MTDSVAITPETTTRFYVRCDMCRRQSRPAKVLGTLDDFSGLLYWGGVERTPGNKREPGVVQWLDNGGGEVGPEGLRFRCLNRHPIDVTAPELMAAIDDARGGRGPTLRPTDQVYL